MVRILGAEEDAVTIADLEADDLPCPWCWGQTSLDDTHCPECSRPFGRITL